MERMNDMKPNWNEIAREVAALEGGKVNLPIAQIKEVLRCFRIVLWRRYKLNIALWMDFLRDLAKRSIADGAKWSKANDSN